jgi:L-ascorbate metabolism protein UlaG (beta-lactamase superfamily)
MEGPPAVYIDPWRLVGRKGLPRAALVLVSHGHFDHASPEDVAFVGDDDTVVAGPASALAGLRGRHHPMVVGSVLELDGVKVTAFPASDRVDGFHPPGAGLGFLVETPTLRFYHAGDTATPLPRFALAPDVIAIPICGGTVFDADAAAAAVIESGCRVAMPIHWGDTQGGWSDAERFRALLREHAPSCSVHTPAV